MSAVTKIWLCDPQTGYSPLTEAVRHKNLEHIEILLAKGHNPDGYKDKYGTLHPPLHEAISQENVDVIGMLLKAGANPNILDIFSYTPLHVAAQLAAKKSILTIVDMLLDAGANINFEYSGNFASDRGWTPLFMSIFEKPTDLFVRAKLLEGGIYSTRHYHVAERLLARGANVNARDSLGRTCLHWAAKYNMIRASRLLVEKGADFDVRDNVGNTPMKIAKKEKHFEMIAFLKEKRPSRGIFWFFNKKPKMAKDLEAPGHPNVNSINRTDVAPQENQLFPCIFCKKMLHAMGGHNTYSYGGEVYAMCTGGCDGLGAYDRDMVLSKLNTLSEEEMLASRIHRK